MTTFSQLVDKMVLETRRPDMRTEIATYLNQTIREVHFDPKSNAVLFYRENLIEEQLIVDKESGFGWKLPDPTCFQGMGLVRYDSINTRDDLTRYPPELTPGRGMVGKSIFYYRAGPNYYFAGCGGVNAVISLAYYEYPRGLKYYAAGNRPCEYDPDMGFTYAAPFDGSEELHAAAIGFTTNWLLMRWSLVIEEGVRAKVYKRLSDTDRQRTAYSLYSQLRLGLSTSESAALGAFR